MLDMYRKSASRRKSVFCTALTLLMLLSACTAAAAPQAATATITAPLPPSQVDAIIEPSFEPTLDLALDPTPDFTPVPTETPDPAILSTPQPDPQPDTVAYGIQVYRSAYCGVCHTLTAANTRGAFAPNHDNVATNAKSHLADPRYTGSATTVEEYLMESLLDPQLYFVPGYELSPHAMPTFRHLSDEDLAALVAMLAAQE